MEFYDPRYCAFFHDTMAKFTANHEYTRVMMNREITVGYDINGGLGGCIIYTIYYAFNWFLWDRN